jgi:hypothetical protein
VIVRTAPLASMRRACGAIALLGAVAAGVACSSSGAATPTDQAPATIHVAEAVPVAAPPASVPRPRVIGGGSSLLVPGGGVAATAPTSSSADSPTARAHDAAQARVDSLVGEPRCASDAQCRTIAVGALACGGPVGYRAWSIVVTDPASIQAASEEERRLAAELDRQAGRMSPCLYLADPGAQCVKGRCETRSGRAPVRAP